MVVDSDGNVVEAAVIARDISARKQMEAELKAAHEAQAVTNRKQALLLNDAVVQGLAVGKLALETGNHEEALRSVASTLEQAKKIVTGLLADAGGDIDPGERAQSERLQVTQGLGDIGFEAQTLPARPRVAISIKGDMAGVAVALAPN